MSPLHTRARILLVEDNADNRGLIHQALEDLDLDLIDAENGEEGVELARAERPDLILMDLSLPVMSGWDATALLKGDPATAAIPVIALTAHAMEGDERMARERGCDAYLTKPIALGALIETVETYLSGSPR